MRDLSTLGAMIEETTSMKREAEILHTTPAELAGELAQDPPRCHYCHVTNACQTYAITVDGVPLRAAIVLCMEHSGRFLVRMGSILGSLEKPIDQVLRDWARR